MCAAPVRVMLHRKLFPRRFDLFISGALFYAKNIIRIQERFDDDSSQLM